MLNDKTVDFLSDGIDCAIRVGAEVDPATVSVLLAEVPRSVVASPSLLANLPPLSAPQEMSLLPWIAIGTFYQHEVRLQSQVDEQLITFAIAPCLVPIACMWRVIPRWRGWARRLCRAGR